MQRPHESSQKALTAPNIVWRNPQHARPTPSQRKGIDQQHSRFCSVLSKEQYLVCHGKEGCASARTVGTEKASGGHITLPRSFLGTLPFSARGGTHASVCQSP